MLDLKQIDSNWALFLDRDGVINHEKYQDYIYHYDEFTFYEGVPQALRELAEKFGPIILTTNQRGVGKGLMTEAALEDIHMKMLKDIGLSGGRIDAIYYSTSVDDLHPDRKPNPGMFRRAQADFPAIDPHRSVMVGNNLSDMEFGRNAGMYTVFVRTTSPDQSFPHPAIDQVFDSLPDFAKALRPV